MKIFIIILMSIAFSTFMCIVPEDLQTVNGEDSVNQAPIILNYLPTAHVINVNLSDSDPPKEVDFSIEAEDPDGDALSYKWEVLNCNESSCKVNIGATDTEDFQYTASLPARELFIGVEVSDSFHNIYHYWILKIGRVF
jgi:hypothetical protein